MFEYLDYPYVIVTGPHRSGTTIAGHMIAHDTGKEFLDEANIYHKYVREIPNLFADKRDIVLQAPYAVSWLPILSDPEIAIVLIRRNTDDIHNSVKRSKNPKGKMISLPPFSPEQAYALWDNIKGMLHNPFEIQYNELKNHPMWLDEKERRNKDWHHKQIDQSGNKYNKRNYAERSKNMG